MSSDDIGEQSLEVFIEDARRHIPELDERWRPRQLQFAILLDIDDDLVKLVPRNGRVVIRRPGQSPNEEVWHDAPAQPVKVGPDNKHTVGGALWWVRIQRYHDGYEITAAGISLDYDFYDFERLRSTVEARFEEADLVPPSVR